MRGHVVGAGPVGLLLTALLQSVEGLSVRLYEKRREYTRTRMVQLAPYLVADSVESYRVDAIDVDSVEAIFDPHELDQGLAFRRSIPSDLAALLKGWSRGFCQLNSIERSISDLIDVRGLESVERAAAVVTPEDAMAMLEAGDVLIDGTEADPFFEITWFQAPAKWKRARTRSRSGSLGEMLDRYELYIYKQWLRVYMRSKMIKHNKDLFESLDDPLALLEKLHIY